MSEHVQLSMLADHVTNVKALEASSVSHLEDCSDCRSDLRWLQRLVALREFEPPESAVDSVMNELRKRKSAA
ncbi:MAG TPA: hypothetical protein VKY31_13895 [Terriglobia bacterium]|nr:hypothetical protein [Terriglobia bacterium]